MRGGVEKIENLYLTIAESFFDNSFDFGIVEVPIRRIARFLPGNGRDLPKKKKMLSKFSANALLKHRQTG